MITSLFHLRFVTVTPSSPVRNLSYSFFMNVGFLEGSFLPAAKALKKLLYGEGTGGNPNKVALAIKVVRSPFLGVP